MLLLALERGLLRFTLNTPALEVLFQLPPQIGKRNSLFPIFLRRFISGCIVSYCFCFEMVSDRRTPILYIFLSFSQSL